ncbi:MAG: formyltetrahydrofolate deformylase [Victivallaceae bacterium]|nr:formyltetrahydrofolate deformylase [Victivallaceae bacterium]
MNIIFLIKCPDHTGLLANISSFFYNSGFNILQCRQYTDTINEKYFMRIQLDGDGLKSSRRELETEFDAFAAEYDLEWSVHYSDYRPRVAIMVSKTSHCLYDLLERHTEGDIHCEIPLVISNHPNLEYIADQFKVPFYCLPVKKGERKQQEAAVLKLLSQHHIDLVVMARYMQILSNDFIAHYPEQIINIHHAFLPAFEGGDPYRRAYERGVKIIGATAHYATTDLDGGPIIVQDVEHISHEHTPADLKQIGKDVERLVLARAVKYHLENRILVSDNHTVVFK